jgi:hypothetical protein
METPPPLDTETFSNESGDYGIEVSLPDADAFLKIKETLTRIGVSSVKTKTLYQSCHILHKRGRYFIIHFKQLFKLDGKASNMDDADIARRNAIVKLLEEWNLLTIIDKERASMPLAPVSQIKILSFKEKNEWNLVQKYTIGSGKVEGNP